MQKNTHPFRALAPLQAGASGQAPAPLTGQGQDRGGQAGVDHCPRAALFVHFDGERQEFPLLIKCRNVFLGSPLHPAWAPGHHFRRPSQGKAAPPVPGAPGSPLNGGHRAPGRGRSLTTMPREALLLLVSLALLLTLPAPLLAFPSAAPDVTASYPKDTTTEVTGEVTISESRGRRSEYIEYDSITEEDYLTGEPSSISTEQYMMNRTQEFMYVKENAGGRYQPCK
eukprot:XP_027305694.1 uncharacterized protein LOC113842444 isoform X1 [Anas platyrhynchos]